MAAKENIRRLEEQVINLENKKASFGKVLFYGNSYFTLWENDKLEEMLSDLPISKPVTINHGFGGATSAELRYYYPRLVKPFKPKTLVWCEGANDFEQGYTPEEAIECAEYVFGHARHDFLDIKLILLTAIETPKTFQMDWIQLKDKYDRMLAKYADQHSNCKCIDIRPFFYKDGVRDKRNFKDIFREDDVHLNDKGYTEFAGFLKDRIMSFLKGE